MEWARELIGREADLAVVRGVLPDVLRGTARVVAVSGPAGIGKSRLAEECLREAQGRGFRALTGVGAVLQQDLAYAPVVEALRPLVRDAGLTDGLPDLGRLFGELSAPVAPRLRDAGLERTRLFESVCRLLERAASRQPMVLLLDDAHWADRDSLAMLQYLVRGLARQRLLVALTYRDDEADTSLGALIGGLRRAGSLTELRLTGLSEPAVHALADDLLGGAAPPGLLEVLERRSGGVPLFVTALVGSLVDSGALRCDQGRWVLAAPAEDAVPEVVSELLRTRIERLPAAAREALDLLAVCGAAAEHDLLGRLLPEDRLLSGLAGLRAARVVSEEVTDGRVGYRAAHPLLAEVAYGLQPLVVRRRRHAEVAAALRAQSPTRVGLLAHHLRLAGDEVDQADVFEVLSTAADEALERKAGDEALVHLRAAREVAGQLSRTDLLLGLMDRIAKAYELAGDRARAVTSWIAAAEHHGARPGRAERLIRAANIEWDAGRPAEYDRLLNRAEAQLTGLEPGPAHARLAASRAHMAVRAENVPELRAWIAELDRLHERTGLPEARRVALGARYEVAVATGRYTEGRAYLAAGIELAESLGDEAGEVARRPGFFIELQWGNLAAARAMAEEGLRLAHRSGVPTLERVPRTNLAGVAFYSGEWDEAVRGAESVIELGRRVGAPRAIASGSAVRGLVEVRRGLVDQACASAAEARAVLGAHGTGDRHLLALVESVEAAAALGRGEPDVAARIAAESLACGNVVSQPLIQSILADAYLALGRPDAASAVAVELSALGPQAPYPGALAAWVQGRARQAPEPLARAAGKLRSLGFAYEAAVAELDLAELTATLPGDHCIGAFERMGARPQLDRARRLARRLGHRPSPPRPRPGRLSAREEQVARLVADGLSNPEIAARLYLSTRTVTTHLHNIYRRLEVSSRTELTRYVLRKLPPNT